MILSRFFECRGVLLVVWVLLLALLVQPAAFALQEVQDDDWATIKKAEGLFEEGSFDLSIDVLTELLKKADLTIKQKQQAYELLAANFLAKTYMEQAENALRKLLTLVPNYRPDPQRYSESFVERVEKVRNELAVETVTKEDEEKVATGPKDEESWYEQPWVWITGGVLVAGAVTAVVLSGGNGNGNGATPLPAPPALP